MGLASIQEEVRRFWGFARLNRVRFLAFSNLILIAVALFGIAGPGAGVLTFAVLGVGVALVLKLVAQRYRDVGVSGFWSVFFLIPQASPFLFLLLAAIPGSAGDNRFGAANPRGGPWLIALALVPWILLALAYWFGGAMVRRLLAGG